MFAEKKLKVGGVEINFAEGPESGHPLVLLHGLPGRWQEFLPILPTLILQWHVYALDFRGQGKSGRIPGQYRAEDYVTDVVEFLQQQFSAPVILYGQSAGGLVAINAAAELPGLVKGVILGDSPMDMELLITWMQSEGFQAYFSSLQEISRLKNHSIPEIAAEIADIPMRVPGQDAPVRYGDTPGLDSVRLQQLAMTLKPMAPDVLEYHATGRAVEFLAGFALDAILAKIQCPVLLLQGNPSLGGMMTDKAVEHITSILPGAEHALLKSAGHDLGMETWEVAPLLRVVVNFLRLL